MSISRREFLGITGAAVGTTLLGQAGYNLLQPGQVYYFKKGLEIKEWKKGICRYCGTGCGLKMGIGANGEFVAIKGWEDYPVNFGTLCPKGLTLCHVVETEERAEDCLLRQPDGTFKKISLDEATNIAAEKLNTAIAKDKDSVALYLGAQLFTEEIYLGNKLFKGVIGTNNVESNARLCMASAVTGFLTTFGIDEPIGNYADIDTADCIFLIGSNAAEMHPPLFGRIMWNRNKNKNVTIISADPRYTPTAAHADIWLPFLPGSDLYLMNAMTYVILNEGLYDQKFIDDHVQFAIGGAGGYAFTDKQHQAMRNFLKGTRFHRPAEYKKLFDNKKGYPADFEMFKEFISAYKPENVEKITGVKAKTIYKTTRIFAKSKRTVTLWTMGPNQRTSGTWCNNMMYNLHLLTGKIGTPGNAAMSLTGQSNACGGVRESGSLAHLLPAHRSVKNKKHRQEIEKVWEVPAGSISPKVGLHTVKLFDSLGSKVKVLYIACSNPAQTMPNLDKYIKKMKSRNVFIIVQDIFGPKNNDGFHNRTPELADLFIPCSFWAEKGGVFGCSERRSCYTTKALKNRANLKADWELFKMVAEKMGHGKYFEKYKTTEDIWDEYRACSYGRDVDLSGASYEHMLKYGGAQWPIPRENEGIKDGDTKIRCNTQYDRHLQRLLKKGEIDQKLIPADNIYFYGQHKKGPKKKWGKAKVFLRPGTPPAEEVDNLFPLSLTTGRVVQHWHTGTMTMRVPSLKKMVPECFIEINELDAKKYGDIKDGDPVLITSKRGSLEIKARVINTKQRDLTNIPGRASIVREGVVFVPFFDSSKLINLVTNASVDAKSKQPEYKVCAVNIKKV